MAYKRFPGLSIIANHLLWYPTPRSLGYSWSFGSMAGLCLVLQILTGLFLTMHYSPTAIGAFDSIEHIMRDVNYGWLIRYLHANGASLFFVLIYLHIARGLYYRSFSGRLYWVWFSGIIMFLLLMAIAFLGYILPWGQMSLWGATVITNLFSAIPVVGKGIVRWLWGGFAVDGPTLMRFYTLHYVLPFVLIVLILIHLVLLHRSGSSSSLPIRIDYITFMPYFYLKDLFSILIGLIVLISIVMFYPESLGHTDNYIKANPMVTPPHIVPEWYFLPFYAILRSIPNKLAGVLLMFSSILGLAVLPLFHIFDVNRQTSSCKISILRRNMITNANYFSKISTLGILGNGRVLFNTLPHFWYKVSLGFFIGTFITLGWLGAQPAQEPYITISLYLTFFYFFYITFGQLLVLWFDANLREHILFKSNSSL